MASAGNYIQLYTSIKNSRARPPTLAKVVAMGRVFDGLELMNTTLSLLLPYLLCTNIVFILDLKGKVLISRNYRGDIPMSAVEKFMPLVCMLVWWN
jgi:hypothetical protein